VRDGSFTERVVAELAPHVPPLGHCRAALLDGMALTAPVEAARGVIETPRAAAVRCAVAVLHADGRVGRATRVRAPRHVIHRLVMPPGESTPSDGNCCRRSRLRGAFIALGSVNRPSGPPHLEIPVRDPPAAEVLSADLAALEVPSTTRRRRGRLVVTVRTAAAVGTALSCIGASAGRLAFEEGRVVRDVRAGVNRSLNAETANLRRVVDAAVRQLTALQRLRADPGRWEALPSGVREAALLRATHPDATLEALAVEAGISRATMAGRLRRLVLAADW
jgi:DNA-binding protein WhiA